jgi:hypothetical protein
MILFLISKTTLRAVFSLCRIYVPLREEGAKAAADATRDARRIDLTMVAVCFSG